MRKLIRRAKTFIILLKADIELWKATRMADKKYRKRNLRFFVIPDYNHRLISRSYGELKKMRKAGMFSNRAKESDFINECFYFTPSKYDKDGISKKLKAKKRKEWLAYVAQVRRLR